MRRKLIHFKAGTITLYDSHADGYFWGRLLVNFKKSFEQATENLKSRDEVFEQTFRQQLEESLDLLSNSKVLVKLNTKIKQPEIVYKIPEITQAEPKSIKHITQLESLQLNQPNERSSVGNPALIDFKFFYQKIFIEYLYPSVLKFYKKIETVQKTSNITFPFKVASRISLGITVISFLLLLTYFSLSQLSLNSLVFLTKLTTSPEAEVQASPSPQFEPTPDPTPVTREFQINIPKINLSSEITPNVDLSDEKVYKQKLLYETGIAHALSSYFPGQDGPIYLFAHSTDTLANIPLFNAKFYALKELELEDEIDISYQGKRFKYTIKSKQIIKPEDIGIIQNTNYKLVLQTCWPPGTDWQRLIIFADPV